MNEQWCSNSEKDFLKKLNVKLPFDPTIPLLGVYLKKLQAGTQTDTPMPILMVGLFTTAKKWKQSKCPFTDKWINKTRPILTMEYHQP